MARNVFTLPVCLRSPNDLGYPPSDESVFKYLEHVKKDNYFSMTAHIVIVSFVTVAQKKMLEKLKDERCLDAHELRNRWHDNMETSKNRKYRDRFFKDVVEEANSASHFFVLWR